MLFDIRQGLLSLKRRYARSERGATAIEYAILMPVFLLMLFGQLLICLYFFATTSLETAIEEASVKIKSSGGDIEKFRNNYNNFKKNYKSEICSKMQFVSCEEHITIKFISLAQEDLTIPSCLNDNNGLAKDTGFYEEGISAELDRGKIPSAILIVCYEWTLAGKIPYFKIGKMNDGSSLIRVATTL